MLIRRSTSRIYFSWSNRGAVLYADNHILMTVSVSSMREEIVTAASDKAANTIGHIRQWSSFYNNSKGTHKGERKFDLLPPLGPLDHHAQTRNANPHCASSKRRINIYHVKSSQNAEIRFLKQVLCAAKYRSSQARNARPASSGAIGMPLVQRPRQTRMTRIT